MSMNRFSIGITLLSLCLSVGCGGNPVAEQSAAESGGNATASATPQPTASGQTPPTDVVSQFLDALRRGGSDTETLNLVTTTAREEIRRTGLVMQPIGSPNAKFEVTRAEMIPDQAGSALVHSLWTEPAEDGTEETSEVVWSVQLEEQQWRISGMVIGRGSGGRMFMIDFENGDDLMAKLGPRPEAQPTERQATVPDDVSLPVDTLPSVIR